MVRVRVIDWCIALLALALAAAADRPAVAQTDEIQVYTGEINAPGELSLTSHNNYAAIGRKQADIPGGVRPDGALNGVTEFGYGVADWLELGAYMPVLYTVTRKGQFLVDGAKLRALAVLPDAKNQVFFYGLNFELGYSARHWEAERVNTELRPILGLHLGRWELIVNPIVDLPLGRNMQLDFAPAARAGYSLSDTWSVALEHYADYGTAPNFEPLNRQQQTGFLVVDYSGQPVDVEFGVGHGFTAASDSLVLKLIVTKTF